MQKNNSKTANSGKKQVETLEPGTDVHATFRELFEGCLRKMYWSEQHLVKALPVMINAAGSTKLQQAITEHLKITREHVARLEKVFTTLNLPLLPQKCDALEGLTMDGEHGIQNTPPGSAIRDVEIILSSLKVENFEITSYNGLITLAGATGDEKIISLLKKNIGEEAEAEKQLNGILGTLLKK